MEALVGLALLSLWFVGLTTLSISTIRATNTAASVTAAVNLAVDKMEEIQNTALADLATGSESSKLTADGTAGSAGMYQRSWTVSNGPSTTTKEVTVRVAWSDGEARQVELKTVLWE